MAAALERASAATTRITERRAQAADLIARREAAQDEQQVAKMLGDLLRSDRFPRWLVTAAVDSLVEDASGNLAGLSGGQFDLTHEDGEFYVIDHADADSRRSVRTLSGGETFQASLALALALSSQMSASPRPAPPGWTRSSWTRGSARWTRKPWTWSPPPWRPWPRASGWSG